MWLERVLVFQQIHEYPWGSSHGRVRFALGSRFLTMLDDELYEGPTVEALRTVSYTELMCVRPSHHRSDEAK